MTEVIANNLPSRGIVLFPHVLVRLGGAPIENLRNLSLNGIDGTLAEVIGIRARIKTLQKVICDCLYNFIAKTGGYEKVTMVNLKRDVYNGRTIEQTRLDVLRDVLSPDCLVLVEEYVSAQNRLMKCEVEGENTFGSAQTIAQESFELFATNEDFLKGILLSSITLYNNVIKYHTKMRDQERLTSKREDDLEVGLIKFLSRMCAKTSPFSTFTKLGIVDFHKSGHSSELMELVTTAPAGSYVKLNNSLFSYLIRLVTSNKRTLRQLPLKLSSTVVWQKEHFRFLTNDRNIESFQRLENSEFPSLVYEFLLGGQMEYDQLAKKLIAPGRIDSTNEDIELGLDRLLDIGFLEVDLNVSGIDPNWDRILLAKLQALVPVEPSVDFLVQGLAMLRTKSAQISSADSRMRKLLILEAHDVMRDKCRRFQIETGKKGEPSGAIIQQSTDGEYTKGMFNDEALPFYFRPEHLFYEDCAYHSIEASCNPSDLTEMGYMLHELIHRLRIFQPSIEERIRIGEFALNNYGEGQPISLLNLYEDYYREIRREEEQSKDQGTNNLVRTLRKKFLTDFKFNLERVGKTGAHLSEFQLNLSDIPELVSPPIPLRLKSFESFACFAQLYNGNIEGKAGLVAVVNALVPGFGKMYSRFLHLFNHNITDLLRNWNDELVDKSEIFVENVDASTFNANIHPPLMRYEISSPGSENMLPEEFRIPVTELEVRVDSKTAVTLHRKTTGESVTLFDLGFQGNRGRSQLFQLLEKVAGVELVSTRPLLETINSLARTEILQGNGWVNPRIVCEQRVVLQRRNWRIKKNALPIKDLHESKWSYFIRLNEWRHSIHIPDDIFVIVEGRGNQKRTAQRASGIRRDDHKPQYISFGSQFLVCLFEKILHRVDDQLEIQEMLPTRESLLKLNKKATVSEFLLQWQLKGQK